MSFPEDYFFHVQYSLIACSSLYKVEALWAFHSPCLHNYCVLITQLTSGPSFWWDAILIHVTSDTHRRHNLKKNFPVLGLLQSICPLFLAEFPEPQVYECYIDISIGTRLTTTRHFHWLWLSAGPVAKKRFLDERRGIHLHVSTRKMFNC